MVGVGSMNTVASYYLTWYWLGADKVSTCGVFVVSVVPEGVGTYAASIGYSYARLVGVPSG